jgi:hypothetical protein
MVNHRGAINLKSLLVLLAIMALGVNITACGGTSLISDGSSDAVAASGVPVTTVFSTTPGTTASNGTQTGGHQKDSNDGDNDPNSSDDEAFLDYGHAASGADERAVTALVKRYYAAAASADGAKVCAQIYGIIAENIAEEYAQSPEFSGPTCAAVMLKLFKQRRQRMAADLAALRVTRVRIEGETGYAFVYLGQVPEPYVAVHRESGAWKMESLFETRLS